MLNQVVLVGRLIKDPELKETEGGKHAILNIAIPRSFKNADGEYETDFLEIKTFIEVAENTCDYCKKGDIIGIKGRLQSEATEKEDGTKDWKTLIIGEKVTFLSSKKD